MALPFTPNPVMSFVRDDADQFIGWFRQEYMQRLESGSEAEVVFDAIPGEIFTGEEGSIYPVIGEVQLQPGASFLTYGGATRAGRIAA